MNTTSSLLQSPLGRVRLIGFMEGTSFLLLLFIAMPLKYGADIPEAVSVVGMLHGILFVLYLAAVMHATIACRWRLLTVIAAIAAAFLPFGPFLFDAKFLKSERRI